MKKGGRSEKYSKTRDEQGAELEMNKEIARQKVESAKEIQRRKGTKSNNLKPAGYTSQVRRTTKKNKDEKPRQKKKKQKTRKPWAKTVPRSMV
jgi:hypothetical protein